MFNELPPWQSARKHQKIRAMMADEPELLARETQGLSTDLHQRAFDKVQLRRFTAREPRKVNTSSIEHVFVAIDPSGGGSSHFAVVSAWFYDGLFAICGLESVCCKSPDAYADVLLRHCELLRAQYRQAVFVFAPEANLGFESSHIARILAPVKFKVLLYEARSGCPGMMTTHASKETMWSLFTERLRDNAAVYADAFVSTSTHEKVKKLLNTQLSNYSIIVDRPCRMTQHFRTAKKTFGGKMHGQDDLAVMAQFVLLARKRFGSNPKYRKYW